MSFNMASLTCRKNFSASIAGLLATFVCMALAAAPATAETGFDISISDLNTVKKKAPSKKTSKETRRKKKSDVEPQQPSSEKNVVVETVLTPSTEKMPDEKSALKPTGPVETPVQTAAPRIEPKTETQINSDKQLSQVTAESEPDPESTRIFHSPYSFVVAGKRTIIQVVIDSNAEIQEVSCTLRAHEGGGRNQVKMEKVEGTQFTYKAVLPGLSRGTSSLSYTVDVVDSNGKLTRSKKFVTPVKTVPFVPSWQLEDVNAVTPEKPNKPAQ